MGDRRRHQTFNVRPRAEGSTRTRRWVRLATSLVLVLGVATGCTLPEPAGVAPLRYRDAIFSTVTSTDGLTYGTAPDAAGNPETLTLDMYQPTGDTQTSRPAIVLVHGGGFTSGTSKAGNMVELANAFAQRGYVAVSINYRLLNTSGEKCGDEGTASTNCVNAGMAAIHDTQAAVRWLRANATTYGVDPSRIAVEGASAGAATALGVAVDANDPGDSGNPGYSSAVQAAISISGELPHSEASLYNSSDAPVLMFNGTADNTVPFAEGVQTAVDLDSAGVPIVFEALQGAGHVPFSTDGPLMIQQSVYFCYDFMNLGRAAGQPESAATAFQRQTESLLKQNPKLAHQLTAKEKLIR